MKISLPRVRFKVEDCYLIESRLLWIYQGVEQCHIDEKDLIRLAEAKKNKKVITKRLVTLGADKIC